MKTCPVCDSDYPDLHATCPTDGAVLIVSHELAAGSLVRGKYRIVRKLGQGGMGVVYLADDTLLGVCVALKFLVGDLGKDPKFIKRFRTEARAAYQLRHPNIVEVTNLDQAEDGSLFIAMEFIEGPSLRAVIERARAGLAVPRALEIARGIAAGLAAAHAQGTVHRDIKPENILLARGADGHEQAKVLDFGIVAIAESVTRQSVTHGLLLTPDYAAPEQWMETPSGEIDSRVDLYALGCVLYEMLTGRTPFHAHNTAGWMKQHMDEAPARPSLLRPELANWQGLDDLVLELLAKDYNNRPHDAELPDLIEAVGFVPVQQRGRTIPEAQVEETPAITQGLPVRPTATSKVTKTAIPTPAATPAPVHDLAQVAPAAPKTATGKFPAWVWVALAVLTLIAATATWRLFQLESERKEVSAPVSAPTVEPATPSVPAPAKPNPGNATAPQPAPTPAANVKPPAPKHESLADAKQAIADYNQGNFSKAGPLLDQACKNGSSESCQDLGNMYHDGHGVAKDDSRAVALFGKACNAGLAKSCVNLGIHYSEGSGVPKDDARAMALYAKACDAGDAVGCSNLGNIYATGRGVAKDDTKAAALYSKACDAGNAAACSNLGNCYRLGRGVQKDSLKAALLLAKGCGMGNQWGCDRLKEMR
jgi:serine/threonine protein kinase